MRTCLHGWTRDTGRRTRVVVEHEAGRILNPRVLAVSSMVGWGKVQDSRRIESSHGYCLWVSTAGHGGYVLIATAKVPEFEKCLAFEAELPDGTAVCAYEFEEDCEWARLLYHDAVALESDWQSRRAWSKATRVEHLAAVEACYRRWCAPKGEAATA